MGAIGAAAIGAAGSIGGGMLAKSGQPSGPDLNAIAANQQGRSLGQSTAQQAYAYLSMEPFLPALLTYAGYTPDQITQMLTEQRRQLADTVAAAHSSINDFAFGSGAQVPLRVILSELGAEKYGYGQDNPSYRPLPSMDNLPTIVRPLNPNLDYHQPGGGKFVFTPTELSPEYQAEQQLGERNLNRQLAARGLFNSGAGVEALTFQNNQLAGQEFGRQLAQQNTEYGYALANNATQRGQQQADFGNLLSLAGFESNAALGQAQLGNQLQIAGMNAGASLAGAAGAQGLGYYQANAQLTNNMFANANNAIQSGFGASQGQQNFNQLMRTINPSPYTLAPEPANSIYPYLTP